MAYIWPPLPIEDPIEAATILAERLQHAYDDLEAERLRVFADPRTLHRRALVDAWIKDFQAAITSFKAAADAEVERFLALHLGTSYAAGIRSVSGAAVSSWTQAHESALTSLAIDTYNDFLQRSEEAGRAGAAMVAAVREASRKELPILAAGGRTAIQAARRLEDRLRDEYRLDHVIYRDGTEVPIRRYATMAARTKSAVAYNAGTLNELQAQQVGYVQVFDGPTCGWKGHDDPDLAQGSIRSLEEAARHPIAHPNCRRAFGPRPDITSPEQAAAATAIKANTGYDDVENTPGFQPAPTEGGAPPLAGTGQRPADAARARREEQRRRRRDAAGSTTDTQPISAGDALTELNLGLFPTDSNGNRPPYLRAQVAGMDDADRAHVWDGDARGGGHDPFNPPRRAGKCVFPRHWLGDDDSEEGRLAAEAIILAGLHEGTVVDTFDQGPGGWRFTIDHAGVNYRVQVVLDDAGRPRIKAVWPRWGDGVEVVRQQADGSFTLEPKPGDPAA